MAKAKKNRYKDLSTEQKIKEAAAAVFQKKGYSATRTRDIAEEAGLNLALINYYFRSKKNLFDIIMEEKLVTFFKNFIPIILTVDISLKEKVKLVSENYTTLLLQNPDLPIFVLTSIHADPQHFAKLVQGAELIQHSTLEKQLKKINPKIKFEQFFINIMALCVFPFLVRPGMMQISEPIRKNFESLMMERVALIPKWMDAMLKIK